METHFSTLLLGQSKVWFDTTTIVTRPPQYHNIATIVRVAPNQHKIAGSHHYLGCGGVFCIGFKQLLIVGGSANDVSLSLKNGVIDHSQSSAVFQRANIGSTNIGT